MLQAAIFVIQKTSYALATFLNVPIPLTDSVTVKMYHLIVFLFILPLFIKFMYIVMTKSVNVSSAKGK